jgi:hypothetical protein
LCASRSWKLSRNVLRRVSDDELVMVWFGLCTAPFDLAKPLRRPLGAMMLAFESLRTMPGIDTVRLRWEGMVMNTDLRLRIYRSVSD